MRLLPNSFHCHIVVTHLKWSEHAYFRLVTQSDMQENRWLSNQSTPKKFLMLLYKWVALTAAQVAGWGELFPLGSWGDVYSEGTLVLFGCNFAITASTKFGGNCDDDNSLSTLVGCIRESYWGPLDHELDMFCNLPQSPTRVDEAWRNYTSLAVDDATSTEFPVRIDQDIRNQYLYSVIEYMGNYNILVRYLFYLWEYWLVVLLAYAICNWFRPLLMRLPVQTLVKNVLTPGLMSSHKDDAFVYGRWSGLIPSRIQSIILFGFLVLTTWLTLANIWYNPRNVIFATFEHPMVKQLSHMYGDRLGIIGTFLLPWVVLFAGRNNIFQWLCGINYLTFLMYHRWILRICYGEILFHTVSFVIYLGVSEEYKKLYMTGGIIGFIFMYVLISKSWLKDRRENYEWFLFLHIGSSVLMLGGLWVHLHKLGYTRLMPWVIGLWAFDRVCRTIRIYMFGIKKAQVTLIDDTLRVVIPISKMYPPGGYINIHFLIGVPEGLQSHPFTYFISGGEMILFIKVKEGITRKLANQLVWEPVPTKTLAVCVDGPYGEPANFHLFDQAVFIAGGHGIPGMWAEANEYSNSGKPTQLIWITRSHSWFHNYLPEAKFPITISATGGGPPPPGLSHQTGRPDIHQLVQTHIDTTSGSIAFVVCGHPAMVDLVRQSVATAQWHNRHVEFFDQLQTWA